MYAGEIVETGTAEEVFRSPLHPYTQGLLRCIPIPGRTRAGQALGAIPGVVPTPIGELVGCQFRNRCAHRFDLCRESMLYREIAPGRSYRCLLGPSQAAANAGAAA
jgi:peptide/nickel transport system ATP-binding protein